MTFVIALANADQIIQLSDRRLSWHGKTNDDSSNKAGHAVCDDVSFLYSFTGLAKIGSHETSTWLLDAFYDAAQKGHGYSDITDAFAEEATSYFHSNSDIRRLSAGDRRLTVMLTGYTKNGLIVNSMISNFQDFLKAKDYLVAQNQFNVHTIVSNCSVAKNPTLIQVIGQTNEFTNQHKAEFRQMLTQRAPAEAICQKGVALIQKIATLLGVNGTIGGKINTARLLQSDPLNALAGYASDVVGNSIHIIDKVNLQTGAPKAFIANLQFTGVSPVVFPRVHRNALCPCGSGLKYRFCHRR